MDKFQYDVQGIEECMKDYGGSEKAHFGFIIDKEKRQIFMGGNVAMIGAGISGGIAELIRIMPGLDVDFADTIRDAVHYRVAQAEEAEVQ